MAAPLRLPAALEPQVESAVSKLRRRQVRSSGLRCRLVASVLKLYLEHVAGRSTPLTVGEVVSQLSAIGQLLSSADREAFCVENVALRVLHLLRDEVARTSPVGAAATAAAAGGAPDLAPAIAAARAAARGAAAASAEAKAWLPEAIAGIPFSGALAEGVADAAGELVDELDNTGAGLAEHAGVGGMRSSASGASAVSALGTGDLFAPGDVVLTPGYSKTVLGFLKAAAAAGQAFPGNGLRFVVTEGGGLAGRAAASELAAATAGAAGAAPASGAVTLIPDEAAGVAMSRVSAVVLPAAAITRNGSVVAPAGAHAIALAAAAHAVPVIVVAAGSKLCPVESPLQLPLFVAAASAEEVAAAGADPAADAAAAAAAAAIISGAAADALPFSVASAGADSKVAGAAGSVIDVLAPRWDVLAPTLVRWVVTTSGVATPAGVARLVDESYGRPAPQLSS